MPGIETLVRLVFGVAVLGLIVWLLLKGVDYCEMGAPFDKVARVVVVVGAIFILVYALLGLMGHGAVLLP